MTRSGIYRIRNIVNEHCYVGSAVDFNRRWYKHKYALLKGIHHSSYLQNAWDLYGKDAFVFEILECVEELNDLLLREQHYKNILQSVYDMCPVAGSQLGAKRSEETKRKIGAVHKGKKLSEETKQKMRKPRSKEACKKQSETMKKNGTTKGQNHSMYGKHLPEEHKRKLSIVFSGKNNPMSHENRLKRANA